MENAEELLNKLLRTGEESLSAEVKGVDGLDEAR